MKNISMLLLLVTPFASTLADQMPKCFDRDKTEIEAPMNETVISYKQTEPNLKKYQVLVKADFVEMLPNVENSYGVHQHYIVSLGGDSSGHIEIAASLNEYSAPTEQDLAAGPIYICGEYSTTREDGSPKITAFEPSKTGAMIHWTHAANYNLNVPAKKHPSGWIYANGKVFGLFADQKVD